MRLTVQKMSSVQRAFEYLRSVDVINKELTIQQTVYLMFIDYHPEIMYKYFRTWIHAYEKDPIFWPFFGYVMRLIFHTMVYSIPFDLHSMHEEVQELQYPFPCLSETHYNSLAEKFVYFHIIEGTVKRSIVFKSRMLIQLLQYRTLYT